MVKQKVKKIESEEEDEVPQLVNVNDSDSEINRPYEEVDSDFEIAARNNEEADD